MAWTFFSKSFQSMPCLTLFTLVCGCGSWLLLLEISSLEGLERLLERSLSNPLKIGWTLEFSSSLCLVLLGAYLSQYSSSVGFLDLPRVLHPDPMISEFATECCFIDAAAHSMYSILITNQHVIFTFEASATYMQIFLDTDLFATLFILNQLIFLSSKLVKNVFYRSD